jgi:hypothetical protein
MEQQGPDVKVWTPTARYLDFTKPAFAGYDQIGLYRFTDANGSGGATVTTGPGYCITNLLLQGVAASRVIEFVRETTPETLRFSFSGSSGRRLLVKSTSKRAFPWGDGVKIDVGRKAALLLDNSAYEYAPYHVHDGGVIDIWSNWALSPQQELVLDGALALFKAPASTYAHRLTFLNGARAAGTGFLMGNGNNGYVVCAGNAPSTAEMDFGFYSQSSRSYFFTVDDVTKSSAVDFTVEGSLYHNFAADTRTSLVKNGPGTMCLKGACTAVGEKPFEVREGVLLLGEDAIASTALDFALTGGDLAVADGKTNACGLLSLKADGAIALGEKATLSFAGVQEWGEGCALHISASAGAKMRLGTSAQLPAAQLRAIRLNGMRVAQEGDGTLVPVFPSLRLIVR